jgi:hypothetical protein
LTVETTCVGKEITRVSTEINLDPAAMTKKLTEMKSVGTEIVRVRSEMNCVSTEINFVGTEMTRDSSGASVPFHNH